MESVSMLYIIVGKTASGKTTIVNRLRNHGFQIIDTYTTRPFRKGDTYHFISNKEFENKIQEGFFAEWKLYDTIFGKWYYGTPINEIKKSKIENKIIILTPKGVFDIVKENPGLYYRLLYIYANDDTIYQRLYERGDNKEEVERRIKSDNGEFVGIESFVDKIFYNNSNVSIDKIVSQIKNYICETQNIKGDKN